MQAAQHSTKTPDADMAVRTPPPLISVHKQHSLFPPQNTQFTPNFSYPPPQKKNLSETSCFLFGLV